MPPIMSKPHAPIDDEMLKLFARSYAQVSISPTMSETNHVFAKWKPYNNKVAIPVAVFENDFVVLNLNQLLLSVGVHDESHYTEVFFNGKRWDENDYCARCGVLCLSKANKCSKCHLADMSVYYCSRQCQHLDWCVHKSLCFKCPIKRYSLLNVVVDMPGTNVSNDYIAKKIHLLLRDCSATEKADIVDSMERKTENAGTISQSTGVDINYITVDLEACHI